MGRQRELLKMRNEIIMHNFNFYSTAVKLNPLRMKEMDRGQKREKSAFNFPYEKSLFDGSRTRTTLDV